MRRVRQTLGKALVTTARIARRIAPRAAGRVVESAVAHVLLRIVENNGNTRERDAINAWLYDARRSYLPGSSFFAAGLAPWEANALFAPPFPSRGRWLVAAAGGGREVAALRARGLDVWCFEPSATLFAGLVAVAAPGHAHRGSFADLLAPDGALRWLHRAAPFDAVLLGSSALSHVTTTTEQHALFATLAHLSPNGPILSSQFVTSGDHNPVPGARFTLDHGFHYVFAETELHALADAHGYRLSRAADWPPESLLWLRK